MLALGAGAGPVGDDADAVGLAIEAHRSARAALTAACNPADSVWVEQNGGDASDEAMAPARATREAASDAETSAWETLLKTRPSDAAALLRMLRYVASAGPMEVLGDARELGRNIAEAAETALAQGAPQEVDWYNPPPGFMASPAIEPSGFTRIETGIRREANRLLGIALAEISRRHAGRPENLGEAARLAEDARLTKKFHINALASIASPEHIEITGWRYVPEGAEDASAPALAGAADAELIALGRQYDALHAVWREAEAAGREPFARRDAALAVASAANADPIKAHEAAWALPGVREACDRAEKALVALDPVYDAIRAQPARTLVGLAVKARANICETWSGGDFELSAGLGEDEDSPMRGVRSLIEACCAAAGVDWQGRPQGWAPAAAQALALGDAELIALGRAFDTATVRDREANDALNAAEDRAEPLMPERPAALIYREGDNLLPLRQCGDAFAGVAVSPSDIEWMTRRPAQREVWVDNPRAQPGVSMVPGKKPRIVHWPEAQARIDEIAAAWDAWHAVQDRVLEEAGVLGARDATADTSDAAAALARQIAAQPARTVEGMRAKIRVAAFYGVCDPDLPAGDGYPGEAAIRSLYRDTPGIVVSTDPSDIRIVPKAVGAAEPDPSLSDQIIACWREWGALPNFDETDQGKANFARMDARRSAVLDAAEALPATLDNLLPKALALAWLQYVEQWHNGDPREEYGTDGRLAVDIDTAICGRLKTHYARAEA